MTKKLSAFEKHCQRTINNLYKASGAHIQLNMETISAYTAVQTKNWIRRKLIQHYKNHGQSSIIKYKIDEILKGDK